VVTRPQLVLVVGLPGTGKTTLAKGITRHLGAAFIRIDAIETAIQLARQDHGQVGAEGYFVAHFLARSNLELGRPVVVDAVCPVPESRLGWADTAAQGGADSIILESSRLAESGVRLELQSAIDQQRERAPVRPVVRFQL